MRRTDHLFILPYDQEAPCKFDAARRFLAELIPFPIEVEHVGSSAVAGLGGKRVIDTLVICQKDLMDEVVALLESAGYTFNPAEGFGTFPERYFVSGWFPYKNADFHVHYHITFPGSAEHTDKIRFRDFLRRHPDVADEYFQLKKDGCVVEGNKVHFAWDKTPFIMGVLTRAGEEARA